LKITLLFPVIFFVFSASAQSDWNQSLRYDLHVKFFPAVHTVDAMMKLKYANHSPDTLNFIWFHVWPNAYRNDRTSYSDQLLENGDTRFYFSSKERKGYINHLDFRVDGTRAIIQDHPEFIDVIKLVLPKPLMPGDSITISSSFHLQVPFNYNGNGYIKHQFEFRNWYPEPAVYDVHGWHPMPFLTQGGAFHETADYTVEIESAPGYLIAAGTEAGIKETADGNRYRFSFKNANSFAWIASILYSVKADHFETVSGESMGIRYYYSGKNAIESVKVIEAAKKEIRLLSEWLGPFPYPSVSIVQATCMRDQDFSGLICIGLNPNGDDWQRTLRKGLLAQWFQTMLLTDQRNQPWFSKGFINYYERRLMCDSPSAGSFSSIHSKNNLWLKVAENEKTTQPVNTAAPLLSSQNDSLIPEEKAGLWLMQLQETLGYKRFDAQMLRYISQWQFRHPYPEDFKKNMDSAGEMNLSPLFDKLNNSQSFYTDSLRRKTKPAFIFSVKNSGRYNYLGLAPIPAYNRYDGFMLGALIHNINLPENRIEFLFTPLYAFGSKMPEGLGRISYSWHPDARFSRISVGFNGGRFNTNKATDSTGKQIFENFVKLVPYIRLDFKSTSPRSTVNKWMDFKTYLITEKSFGQFSISSKDSLIHPNSVSTDFRYVNQLSFNLRDSRALYPYGFRLEIQQSELFYRINLHADYFLNYPDGGGLQVRLFAAKFGVWNENNNAFVSRYEPKLLGVDGNEDYLYEDYFVGRSASYALENSSVSNGGLAAQQIMNRDGGLKLRVDDFDYVQGKSANWVGSLNFNTSLPAGLFPFPLPLRIFFDVGTYAEAWQNNPLTNRFLYTGGIQLSLFKNLLNIYAPLVYSNDFNDALRNTSFGRKITFSIDIQNINYKKIIRKLADHD
jgi:hypothetical protein